ncbi:MAG: 3',5'-cyclic-AMP phosphodiesterase [Steroidobacteraceae bacterium]|jgi:Icc protein
MNLDVRLLQLTDPHLLADPQGQLRGVQTLESLQRVLAHAAARKPNVDAVLCSGDIVNDEPEGYTHFARALGAFGKPVYCVPGNHDDPARMRSALRAPVFQVGGHVDLGAWRIVLIDSCVPGQAGGRISEAELRALDTALRGSPGYALICVHHHPIEMSSEWLDALGIANSAAFFEVLDSHPQVRAVSWGHVHQCFDARRRGVRLLATPSTCIQFVPLSNGFAVDARPPGYRRLTLHADGAIDTDVVWIEPAAGVLGSTASRSG